eukprot:885344-Amphidinium_carterae.1
MRAVMRAVIIATLGDFHEVEPVTQTSLEQLYVSSVCIRKGLRRLAHRTEMRLIGLRTLGVLCQAGPHMCSLLVHAQWAMYDGKIVRMRNGH